MTEPITKNKILTFLQLFKISTINNCFFKDLYKISGLFQQISISVWMTVLLKSFFSQFFYLIIGHK